MTEEKTICPYPGLRPFNEEESIFFKGREEHIEKIISLLEKNKFLMLTGASGDGKSSLVYAGLIPNARAGFFKARYNNWLVADFRPERTPLKNFSKAIASHFKLDVNDVEKELGYGFSSLVKMYKSTPFYVDQNTEEWKNADEKGKKALKRKGANLLILVDQFEEFFTNPENYTAGKPSVQAQAAINLLLETAKISLSEDLPIYIICTMRSDYIGQCANFRGLPEYIGFSQFFVPRLKRKEIHQVIEEPALLSGSKISNRLTETLINQLDHGLDQLPVLQHALNQIWNKTAANEEMDLIHLAKLAGLPKNTLPEKDKQEFNSWFNTLPELKKTFFEHPSLDNVLNAHANELFEGARDYYNSKYNKNISVAEAHQGIKKAFQCLTKIDDSRAVRNRMTLSEITAVINTPDITSDVVSGLLEIFRMQGNTFVKPFISDSNNASLKNDDVLDITHESLIRNWDILKQWAEEENENRQIYLDFYKQLERWIANNKSSDYLLSAGPLSFFEEWYNKCNPNKYWLLKYDESDKSAQEKLAVADKTIKDTIDFLSKSRKAITRKRNVYIVAASIVMFVLSGFTVWAMMERKNAISQKEIANQKTMEAMASEQVAERAKNIALELKTKAEESKTLAESAKENAINSQQEALIAKTIAERERIKAEQQTVVAINETKKAEEQRKIADEARDKALVAESKAKKLTLISVAQALALKSTIIEEDKQLQALLAVQSYNFTLLNKENVQNPIIYEALRSAYNAINPKNTSIIKDLAYEPRTISANSNGTELLASGKSGVIDYFNLANGAVIKSYLVGTKKLTLFTHLSSDNKKLICGYNDGTTLLWDISDLEKISNIELNLTKQKLTTAAFNSSNTTLVTVSQDSIINFWDISNAKQPTNIGVYTAKGSIKFVLVNDNNKSIYYCTETGNINFLSLSDKTSSTIFNSKTSIPLCLAYSKHKNQLAAGFSDGKVRLINLSDNTIKTINDHTARAEHVAFNASSTLLATAGSDKTVRVYDLAKEDNRPIVLRNSSAKARNIIFINDYTLSAAMSNKSIYTWELSSAKIAEAICPLIKRDLTVEEWKHYVGEAIEFQKTCK